MRLYGEYLALGLVAAVAAWVHRAPHEPVERATYLCRPVAGAGAALAALSSRALRDSPWSTLHPGEWNAQQQCVDVLLDVFAREEG